MTNDRSPSRDTGTDSTDTGALPSVHRRNVLRAVGSSVALGALGVGTTSAAPASFGDGVNLQPSYFCSGDQELGWDLMDQYPDIETVRIEIEPFSFDEVVTTRDDAKRWIDEAAQHGYEIIATYHHYPDNGSADAQALQNAADWWVEHYDYLSQDSSFTINVMNEWGDHQVTASQYAAAYNDAISTVRSGTDYSGPIVCDAPGWGQETHRLADAASQIDDDDLVLSAHVYGDGWNAEVGENLQPSHLDVMDETGYPCMVGEFGANRSGGADWSAVVDHANDLGWPVVGWAWNGDGSDDPMNMSDPYWGDDCSATSYSTAAYFDTIYDKLGGGGGGGDTEAPTTPSNLSVTGTTDSSVDVSWDVSSDSGGSGLDHYAVSVDGSQDHTVAAGTTSTTVSGLSAGTSYEIAVSAVDGAGNESATTTVTATTDEGTGGGGGDALVVHEFETGNYPGNNDLGNWADGGSFQNGAGTVSSGALRLEYDNSGWFGSNVSQSVADKPTLNLRIRGDSGGEESHFTVQVGGASDVLANVTSDTIGTSYSTVSVDLEALGADLQNPESVRLDFWQGASGAIEIDRIAFGGGSGGGGGSGDEEAPTTPSNLSVTGTTDSSVDVSWDASTDTGGSGLDHYVVYLDGSQDHTVTAGTTSTSVSGLSADTSYQMGVSAVDGAGNESATTSVSATTDAGSGGGGSGLVVNDYDGSPAWPGSNDLGNWNGAGSFQNGGGSGEVVSGELVAQYDGAGWIQERIDQDVSDYTDLVFEIRGESGGEGQQFAVSLGGASNTFASVADSAIGTTSSAVRIDMQAAGIDRSSPGELQLDFWQGSAGASTIYVEEIRFE